MAGRAYVYNVARHLDLKVTRLFALRMQSLQVFNNNFINNL